MWLTKLEVDVSLGSISFVVNGAAALMIVVLDYFWKDGRTNRHRRVRTGLCLLMGAGIVIGLMATYQGEREKLLEVQALHSQLATLESQNTRLSVQVSELQKMLEPLVREIKRRHPQASDDEVRSLVKDELGKWDVGKWDRGTWDKKSDSPE